MSTTDLTVAPSRRDNPVGRVLLGDEPRPLRDALAGSLRSKGYLVECAATEAQILNTIYQFKPSLLILDTSLYERLGATLIRKVKHEHHLPVVMLAKRGEEDQVLAALEAGADDFMMRPIDLKAMTLKLEGTFAEPLATEHVDDNDGIACGPVVIYPARRAVEVRGQEVYFPKREYELLLRLVREPRRVRTRDELLREMWPRANGDPRSLYAHVKRLRSKIELDKGRPQYIKSVPSVGYLFDPSTER